MLNFHWKSLDGMSTGTHYPGFRIAPTPRNNYQSTKYPVSLFVGDQHRWYVIDLSTDFITIENMVEKKNRLSAYSEVLGGRPDCGRITGARMFPDMTELICPDHNNGIDKGTYTMRLLPKSHLFMEEV